MYDPLNKEEKFLTKRERRNARKMNKRGRKGNVVAINTQRHQPNSSDILIEARNAAQSEFIAELNSKHNSIVFGVGPAGTGKTLLATLTAIKLLLDKKIKKIVISRPNIAAGGAESDIGFLPGGIDSKMAPWMMPVIDVFEEAVGKTQTQMWMKNGTIEIVPTAFIRGRTFKKSCVILDEAQNLSDDMMKATLTRLGDHSKMFICGDIKQTDLNGSSGLAYITQKVLNSDVKGIQVVEFSNDDIERHEVVSRVLELYGE